MGLLSGMLSALVDPVAIITGALMGLLFLDWRPSRVQAAVMLLGLFIWTAVGASFEVDFHNSAYRWVEGNSPATPGTHYVTTRYLDDRPAKLRLELTRFAATMAWMGVVLTIGKGLRRRGT